MKDRCWLIAESQGGGGNALSANHFAVRRTAAIGDVLAATIVADKLISNGYPVVFQAHASTHCVLRRHRGLSGVGEPNGFCHVNLDGAYERDAGRRQKTFGQMFLERANEQLQNLGLNLGPPRNCKPHIHVEKGHREAADAQFAKYPRPWIFICPRSNTYVVRQVPDGIWAAFAPLVPGTKFWLGTHPAPPGIVDLQARHLDNVIVWLSVADLLVSVDTGPMHVAAALGVPVVAINQSSSPHLHLNDQNDFAEVSPPGLDCLNCQANVCPKNSWTPPCQNVPPELIAEAVNARLRMYCTEDVSAVVAIYQPEVAVLNRCLECLIPQVQEIIVCAEGNSRIPAGSTQGGKIRYVQTNERAIGYGRNTNHGARHSNGKYLLLINDDVFLNPGAVEGLKREMNPGVGAVTGVLRYPDGSIYHCGKVRAPGVRGWGHCNLRQHHLFFTQPTELENMCGACTLVTREAFYAIDGFDEDFFIYAEDDAFMLALRRAGYRLIFTPHSEGIHLEHQSTTKIGDIAGAVNRANATFTRKWGPYLDWNLNRVPGDFAYLKA
jgi:GT2 family glycosyltransferase